MTFGSETDPQPTLSQSGTTSPGLSISSSSSSSTNRSTTSPQETIETMRNILDTIIPTQVGSFLVVLSVQQLHTVVRTAGSIRDSDMKLFSRNTFPSYPTKTISLRSFSASVQTKWGKMFYSLPGKPVFKMNCICMLHTHTSFIFIRSGKGRHKARLQCQVTINGSQVRRHKNVITYVNTAAILQGPMCS